MAVFRKKELILVMTPWRARSTITQGENEAFLYRVLESVTASGFVPVAPTLLFNAYLDVRKPQDRFVAANLTTHLAAQCVNVLFALRDGDFPAGADPAMVSLWEWCRTHTHPARLLLCTQTGDILDNVKLTHDIEKPWDQVRRK